MRFKKSLILVLMSTGLILGACQQSESQAPASDAENAASSDVQYDSLTAKKYGADEYGMKKYVFAFLKRGPNKSIDQAEAGKLQTAHLKNIQRMAKAGKLVLAGPFFGDGELRGIYIFDVPSITEAEELTNTDPAIKAGVLEMELKEWYGSAALLALNDIHPTLAKKDVATGE